jgi:hypothetical protein
MKTKGISLENRGSLTVVVRAVVTQPGVRASNRVLVINQVSMRQARASMRREGNEVKNSDGLELTEYAVAVALLVLAAIVL